MKEKKKRRLVLTIKIPVIPVICVVLILGVLSGVAYYALTYGERMLYARHVPENKEPLEIDFVYDKPDDIVFYDGGLFGKKLSEKDRDRVWELFQSLIVTHGAQEKTALKGSLYGKRVLEKYGGLSCLDFRYEQRRKPIGDQAFEDLSCISPAFPGEYDGLLIYLTKDLAYHSPVFYKDLKRDSLCLPDYGFDFVAKKRFQAGLQEILEQ